MTPRGRRSCFARNHTNFYARASCFSQYIWGFGVPTAPGREHGFYLGLLFFAEQ